MARVNFGREFEVVPDGLLLPVERPTLCDSRMMPYEWLVADDGRWLKLDAAIHGDDHFFPGPCDIAWDLAGIVVEWNLTGSARQFLLDKYQKQAATMRRIEYEVTSWPTLRFAWHGRVWPHVRWVRVKRRIGCSAITRDTGAGWNPFEVSHCA